MTSDVAKTRILRRLRALGHVAESGTIRLSHPFCVSVSDVGEESLDALHRIVVQIDPASGRIVGAAEKPLLPA